MPRHRKLAVSFIFLLGAFVVVASVIRLVYVIEAFQGLASYQNADIYCKSSRVKFYMDCFYFIHQLVTTNIVSRSLCTGYILEPGRNKHRRGERMSSNIASSSEHIFSGGNLAQCA